MKAGETSLLKLTNSALQFVVPIYQRTYSWTTKHCNQLWNDILQMTLSKVDNVHFIGSVVYIDLGTPRGKPQQLLLIDGQQRLTTLSLLLCAMARHIDKHSLDVQISSSKIKNYFLFNNDEKGNDRYKMLLTEQDKETFIRILEGTEITLQNPSEKMLENFRHFQKKIVESEESVDTIYEGIDRLMLVSVSLDKTQDNPQLIFESMNSTGKDLSQADLIRNYILLGQPPHEQEKLYCTYWRPMEQGFGQQGYTDYFDWFMRDFLTSQNNSGRICKKDEVYDAFKVYRKDCVTNEKALIDVYTYAQYYIAIHLGKDKDAQLNALWAEIRILDVSVSYPFLMRVYNDYENAKIYKQDFITIIKATIGYIVRRVICEIPTNSLNKTFSTFYNKIKQDNYMNSILAEYVTKDSYRSFPTDQEIKEKMINKDIYHLRIKNYLLESLENQSHKEPISISGSGLTVEHIIPQNPELKKEWRDMLGDNWKEVQRRYLHTIGNLSVTGYNSELSDSPFHIKQTIKGGFKDSHLRLNKDLGDLSKWTEAEILNRTKILAEQVVSIWQYPIVTESEISAYTKKANSEPMYTTMEHYQNMSNEISAVYQELDRKILSLDAGIKKEFKQQYIAYKVDSNFVNVKVSKNELTVGLNMPYDDVFDPEDICRDTTNTGNFANNDILFKVTSNTKIGYVMDLVVQSLNYQIT